LSSDNVRIPTSGQSIAAAGVSPPIDLSVGPAREARMNPGSVFISHSSRPPDFEITRVLAEKPASCGLSVWWDKEGLEGGNEFTAEIVEAIIRQHDFLFLMSRYSVASKWCRRELARASELGKTIIPLQLDDVPPETLPLDLAGLHYIDLRQGVESAFPSVLRALGLVLGQKYDPSNDPFARDGRLVQAIAEQLQYGNTFTESLNLVQMLSTIGQRCCETERARSLFSAMIQRDHYTGPRIDYAKVSAPLIPSSQTVALVAQVCHRFVRARLAQISDFRMCAPPPAVRWRRARRKRLEPLS